MKNVILTVNIIFLPATLSKCPYKNTDLFFLRLLITTPRTTFVQTRKVFQKKIFRSSTRYLSLSLAIQVRHKYFRKIPREIVNLHTLKCLIFLLFLVLFSFCTFWCRTLSNFYTKFDFFFQIVWDEVRDG